MTRLPEPAPIPTRSDETWRVAPERWMDVVEPGGVCTTRGCTNEAVAVATRNPDHLVCDPHLRESLMWVEGGRVVSWTLSR